MIDLSHQNRQQLIDYLTSKGAEYTQERRPHGWYYGNEYLGKTALEAAEELTGWLDYKGIVQLGKDPSPGEMERYLRAAGCRRHSRAWYHGGLLMGRTIPDAYARLREQETVSEVRHMERAINDYGGLPMAADTRMKQVMEGRFMETWWE